MPTEDQFLPAFKLASWNGSTHFGEKLIISLFFLLGMLFYQNSLANEIQSPVVFEVSHSFSSKEQVSSRFIKMAKSIIIGMILIVKN